VLLKGYYPGLDDGRSPFRQDGLFTLDNFKNEGMRSFLEIKKYMEEKII